MTFNDNARLDTSKVQRRGTSRGGKIAIGGGIGAIALFLISQFVGVDLTGLAPMLGGGQSQNQTAEAVEEINLEHCQTGSDANEFVECRMAGAADSIDRYWSTQVSNYRAPGTVLFTGATNTACGSATSATGPFYCPADETIYVDTDFFETLKRDFHASGGPLAQMYVLAHEWGHHISNLTGQMQQADRGGSGPASGSVRLELQADCFAGSWVQAASTVPDAAGVPYLKPVTKPEIVDALDAAAAVGDDRIQQAATGRVDPEGWTHGSAEQRQRWFAVGADKGPTACATFDVPANQL
ncbi:KPN_02809 family neutral zinc metallopeptidase [Leucobacter sp. M11]|uniref:KPN_02809 family neutral zinc metallopeptidase n=1 Tax=Leucobacter sp. M11 TaxID=2993565 RepID=UPI002D7E6A95|nr:neutral zinc metallopeptidase [Leucobacter sp. M11]MEB4614508.1 neutral zinc metallopeptidase [Leucobacter sp. M11]